MTNRSDSEGPLCSIFPHAAHIVGHVQKQSANAKKCNWQFRHLSKSYHLFGCVEDRDLITMH